VASVWLVARELHARFTVAEPPRSHTGFLVHET